MYSRHELVWLSERGWRYARATVQASSADAVDLWHQADWPAVVRRAEQRLAPELLAIGIALPPAAAGGVKTRIACHVPAAEVRRHMPPLRIAQAIEAAPQPWQPLLAALEQQAATVEGMAVRVYGSVALQALTGQSYLTAASDIDLLLHPATRAQLFSGLDLLSSHATRLPLDGEIVFPRGRAVAWKELLRALGSAPGSRVLVKHMQGVSLETAQDLVASLKDKACTR